jgi:hypothetical protein
MFYPSPATLSRLPDAALEGFVGHLEGQLNELYRRPKASARSEERLFGLLRATLDELDARNAQLRLPGLV